jgi:hypothetical protein
MNAKHPWFKHWNDKDRVEKERRKAQHRVKRPFRNKPLTEQAKQIIEAKGFTA